MSLLTMKRRCLTLSPLLIKKILLIYPSSPSLPTSTTIEYMLTYCLCLDEPELFPIESV